MSGMDNANDLSSVNNASGSPPVAPAPAASDAPAPPLAAANAEVGDYGSIMYKVLTKGDGTEAPCDDYPMPAKVISVDPENKTFVAEGVFAAGAFGSTSVEKDKIPFGDPDWSLVPEVAGMSEGERIAFFYDKLKKFYLDTVYKHDTSPSNAFLKMETSRGPLVIQVSPGAKPCRIILNGDLPIATPFDVNQFVAEKFGGDVGAAPSAAGTKRPGSGSAQMDSGACIELEDLQKHTVEILGYKCGTGIDWWVRLDDGRAGWARDDDIEVALPEEQIEEAEKEFGLAKAGDQRRRVRRRVAGPSRLREKDLPQGWHREKHHRKSGGVYHVYRGPDGLRATSVPDVWRKRKRGEVFGDKDEVTLPDDNAATEVDEMLDAVMRAENRETPSETTDAKDAEAMATEPLEARPAPGPAAVLLPAAEPSSAKRVCGTRIGASVCGLPAFHLGPCQGEAVCPRRRCVPAPKMESIKSFRIFGSCGYVTGADDKVDHPVPDCIGADIEVYSALEDKWNRGTINAINATEVYSAEEGKWNVATVFDVEYSTTTRQLMLNDGVIRWRFAEPKPPASSSGACGRASEKARVLEPLESTSRGWTPEPLDESMGEPPPEHESGALRESTFAPEPALFEEI